VYEPTINLFQLDIKENPSNFASYHNMALAQTYLGIAKVTGIFWSVQLKNFEKTIEIRLSVR